MDLRLLGANASSNGSQLVTKPCVSGFVSEPRMPCHEVRKTKCDAALYAKLRQRTIHHGLLTIQSFNQCVRQLQVLFECESTRPNGLGGSDQTNKVQIKNQFAFQNWRHCFCAESEIDSPCDNILVRLSAPRRNLQSGMRSRLPYAL